MGLLKKKLNKKKEEQSKIDEESTTNVNGSKTKGKFHFIKKHSKSALNNMQLVPSIPATLYDYLNENKRREGDDYVVPNALDVNGVLTYPILLLSDYDLKATGLLERGNKKALGGLSVGLKAPNGDNGFLTVITDETLADGYIGLLLSYEAFNALNSFNMFSNYDDGFELGLLTFTDANSFSVEKTGVRFHLSDWLQVVNRQQSITYFNGEFSLGEYTVMDSNNALSFETESADGQADEGFADDYADGFDIDSLDDMANLSDEVDDSTNTEVNDTLASVDDGFDIDALDDLDDTALNTETIDNSAQGTVDLGLDDVASLEDSLNDVDNNTSAGALISTEQSVDSQSTNSVQNSVVANSNTVVSSPVNASAQNGTNVPVVSAPQQPVPATVQTPKTVRSTDDLYSVETVDNDESTASGDVIVDITDKKDLTAKRNDIRDNMRRSSKTHATISISQFIEDYVDNLEFRQMPYLDETGDESSLNHQLNKLIRSFNERGLATADNLRKQMTSLISLRVDDVLNTIDDSLNNDKMLGRDWNEQIKVLTEKIADIDELEKNARLALVPVFDKMTNQLADREKRRKSELANTLSREVELWKEELEQRKQSLINDKIADLQQSLIVDRQGVYDSRNAVAENVIRKSYGTLSKQFETQYVKYQSELTKQYDLLVNEIQKLTVKYQEDEFSRVAKQAKITNEANRVHGLQDEIDHWKRKYDTDMAKLMTEKSDELRRLEEQQSAKIKEILATEQQKLQAANMQVVEQQQRVESLRKEHRDDLDNARSEDKHRIEELKADLREMKEASLIKVRGRWIERAGIAGIAVVLGVFAGATFGMSHSNTDTTHASAQTTTTQQPTQANPIIVYPQAQQSSEKEKSSAATTSKSNSSVKSNISSSSDSSMH